MLVNHGLTQQSCKEEYEPWKRGAIVRYYTSHKDQVTNEEVRAKIQHQRARGCPCQEMQTAVVWTRLPFVRSGQNQLASHSERGKKTRPTEEEVGRQHQGMDRPGVCQVHRAVENRKMEETGSEVICGAPATLAAKE